MTSRGAYYNEIEPFAADWLRNLIAAGHIAAGDVDTRSIVDVQPDDLRGYAQAHFFAGVGVWSYALRLAGVPDDARVWTGSCPCQPFSAASRGDGFADERHLWPAFHRLIAERRPPVVFGEQVASKVVDDWVDLVQADLEALDYAFGTVPFSAASLGAPHIRDRLYWVADATDARQRDTQDARAARSGTGTGNREARSAERVLQLKRDRPFCLMADASGSGSPPCERPLLPGTVGNDEGRATQQRHGASGGLADTGGAGSGRYAGTAPCTQGESQGERGVAGDQPDEPVVDGADGRPGPLHGFWRDADWLLCRDGRWRPVEPGTSPLAHGAPARVGRLRAYGNAICAPQAARFVAAFMEDRP